MTAVWDDSDENATASVDGMRLSERLALIALGVATTVASAATVLSLEHFGVLALSPRPAYQTAPVAIVRLTDRLPKLVPPAPRLAARPAPPPIAYVPVDAVPALTAPPAAASAEAAPAEQDPVETAALEPGDSGPEIAREAPAPVTSNRNKEISASPPTRAPAAKEAAPDGKEAKKEYSLGERLVEISPAANRRLLARFEAANAVWPPAEIALVAIKDEKVLELFARPKDGAWKQIHRYPVLAASGKSGPKLRRGDRQVPEGIYGITFLNPNSRYHVSLRVNYPNDFDREMAAKDRRADPGGDIMIHGKAKSVGCLAIGDEAAEELFVLAAGTGLPAVKLIIAPTDFRYYGVPSVGDDQPAWVPKLYTQVASAMAEYKSPKTGLLSFFGN